MICDRGQEQNKCVCVRERERNECVRVSFEERLDYRGKEKLWLFFFLVDTLKEGIFLGGSCFLRSMSGFWRHVGCLGNFR